MPSRGREETRSSRRTSVVVVGLGVGLLPRSPLVARLCVLLLVGYYGVSERSSAGACGSVRVWVDASK